MAGPDLLKTNPTPKGNDMTKLTPGGIAAALAAADPRTVAAAIEAVEAQAPEARAEAENARKSALDPTLTDAQARAARKTADDLAFLAERLEAARDALRSRLTALEAAAEQQGKLARYTAAKALMDAATARAVQEWDPAAATLAAITLRMEEAILAVNDANRSFNLPAGAKEIEIDPTFARLREDQTGQLLAMDGRRVLAHWRFPESDGALSLEEVETLAGKGKK